MAAFAKPTFSASSYATFRPSYPQTLYNTLLAYHRGPKRICLDLGCGTGIVTRSMAQHFDRVIGTDPSPGMIRQAREQTTEHNVSFHQSSAEISPPFLQEGEVDCVVAGQSAHWFDYARWWPEMRRILRPEGSLAVWGYKDPVLVDFARATEVLDRSTYGEDAEGLGPYLSQPGRGYVRDLLRVVRPPPSFSSSFGEVERIEYEPACRGARSGEGRLFMEKRLSGVEMKEYYRTWSSFLGWREAHPGQVARSRGGEGDLLDRMFDEMRSVQPGFPASDEEEVDMEWGSALVMMRKR